MNVQPSAKRLRQAGLSALVMGVAVLAGCATPAPPSVSQRVAVDVDVIRLERVIAGALAARDWKVVERSAGRFVAEHPARDDEPVTIAVVFDSKSYEISYVETGGRPFGKRSGKVRGAYERWIAILRKDIESGL